MKCFEKSNSWENELNTPDLNRRDNPKIDVDANIINQVKSILKQHPKKEKPAVYVPKS